MEVSQTKSVVSASNGKLAEALMLRLNNYGVKYSLKVKSLGVGLAAGVRRNTMVQNDRLKKFRKRVPRFQALRRVGVDTARVMRTGGTAAMTHGEASLAVSPSLLLSQRRAATAAGAPKGGLWGQ